MGELLEAVELEHQPLMKRLVPWIVRVPKACQLGVKDDLVTYLGWQGLEKAIRVEVVVPVLHIVRGVGGREGSIVGYCFFWEVHLSRGPRVVWSHAAKVSAVKVWS